MINLANFVTLGRNLFRYLFVTFRAPFPGVGAMIPKLTWIRWWSKLQLGEDSLFDRPTVVVNL